MHGKPKGALAFHISPSTLCQEIRFPWGIQSLGTPRPAIAPSSILKSVCNPFTEDNLQLRWPFIFVGVPHQFSGLIHCSVSTDHDSITFTVQYESLAIGTLITGQLERCTAIPLIV